MWKRKNNHKSGSFVRDLGCTMKELTSYTQHQWYPHPETGEPMTWDNWGSSRGKWQIHHIIPLSEFDLTDREQFLKACHYTNLKPLWFEDHTNEHRS